MNHKVNVNWKEEMAFEATVDNHKIVLDAAEAVGGRDRGPRPKALTLVSLGGCTGMDVVSKLGKMRVNFGSLNIEVEGEVNNDAAWYYPQPSKMASPIKDHVAFWRGVKVIN